MHKRASARAVASTALIIAVFTGCSMFSPSNVPVDCNVVKLQTEAGKTDAEIAANLGSSVSEVAACHGPMTSGNKSSGMTPSPY
jgi:hypothetical protein